MAADVGPHLEQDALAFVVARAVRVRLAEVAGHDRSVDRGDDLAERDLLRSTREHVATADAALGANEPGALQCQQNLFEIRLGESGAFGDVTHGRGPDVVVQREAQQRPAGVITPRRHLHDP